MNDKFVITQLLTRPIEKRPVEIVERKGIGHPDSICDGITERLAIYLTKYYVDNFGMPLHFNVDKAVLVGGRAQAEFGGGKVLEPILIHLVGRATREIEKNGSRTLVPIEDLAEQAVKDYIRENFRFLDPDEHIRTQYSIRPGSVDLVNLFKRKQDIPLANDTSIGVGYAPYSTTEKLCLELESFLNSKTAKKKYPAIGEDVKVLCVRKKEKITATVAMAMVSREVRNLDEYISIKESVKEELQSIADRIVGKPIELRVNMADDIERKVVYLTVTGTSAESGDDGQVGRGNRASGLITPYRPMSMEAAAGKNAVSHVGKIYQITARRIAQRIYQTVSGVHEVYVILASTIGQPITEPQIVDLQYIPSANLNKADAEQEMKSIAEEELSKITTLWKEFLERKLRVF